MTTPTDFKVPGAINAMARKTTPERRWPALRLSALVAASLLTLLMVLAEPGSTFAQVAPKAKANDLIKSAPFDRITLIDNTTHDVEPITPRPLPSLEPKKPRTLVEIEENARKLEEKRRAKRSGKEDDEDMVIIHLLEGETRDFKVKRASIKNVEYFEDMIIAEADKMLLADDYTRAFERYLFVKNRDPNWKGLDDHVNRLLFEEGSATLVDDNARGLRLLNDLFARKPDYPGLADRLASSYAKRIDKAVSTGDFLTGRRLLGEMETIAPSHPDARAARTRLIARAKTLVDEASRSNPTTRVGRLAEAVRIWPSYDGLKQAYLDAFHAEPTLNVAVLDVADPIGPFPRSPASERTASLIYLPILANDDEAATRGEVPGQLLAGLEVVELGTGLKIRLKQGPSWSDGSRPVSSIDVARSLADRALPGSPGYNSRWADLLVRVEVVDEERVDIKLTRPSMKPEIWLLDPAGPAHAGADGRVSSLEAGRKPVGDGPFRWEASGEDSTLVQSSGPTEPSKVRRVRETRQTRPDAAVEALIRGDVTLLEHVPPERVSELAKVPGIKVGRFGTPSVHRIALDGRTPALRNRNLRRALSMAIDRRGLLEELILRRPPDDRNLVSDGPFVKGSFIDATDVNPFEYNPLLAKALVAASKKELGGNPIKLTLEYPSTPEARAVCPKFAEAFKLVGVEVELVERLETDLETALRNGRRFDLAYRSSRPTQPLRDAGPLLIPGYDAPGSADALASASSSRILQLLLLLDRAPETTTARTMAIEIDRESRDELPVLALWQLEDHYAWRSQLKGPLDISDQLYQGINTWELEPWLVDGP